MTTPSINDYFGSTAEVLTDTTSVTASPTSPVLVIPFDALSSAGLDNPDSMSDPDKVFGAILKLTRTFTTADTGEESGIEVEAPRKTFITRANTVQIGYNYSVTVYTADTTPSEFDPDSVN
jgi:hypothetical protein